MPDAFGRPTEEELRALMLRQSSGMINQSALLPERIQATEGDRANAMQDFSGKEAALAAQMRGGQQQMNQAMPQGRTVGNQYLAPNWAESLSGAVSKGMGAYDMAQARGGQRGLEKARKEKADALGKVAGEDRYNKAMAVDTANQRNRGIDARDEKKLAASIKANELAATRAEAARVESERRYEEGRKERSDKILRDGTKAEKVEERRLNTEKRRLTEKIDSEGITGARTKLDRFFKVIEPFETKDADGNPTGQYSDIPGIGGLTNSQLVGGVATFAEDTVDDLKRATGFGDAPKGESGTGAIARSAYTDVLNQKVKDISGGAVPVAEWIRNQVAAGYSVWNDEMDAVEGMREIRKALDTKEANIIGGYEDEVISRFKGGKTAPAPTSAQTLTAPDEEEEYQAWLRSQGK
jgi:hypothetical protein